jgi:hypothetical protein
VHRAMNLQMGIKSLEICPIVKWISATREVLCSMEIAIYLSGRLAKEVFWDILR